MTARIARRRLAPRDSILPLPSNALNNRQWRDRYSTSPVKYDASRAVRIIGRRQERFIPVWVDGVFEGGGTLGLAYLGALRALQDNNIWFERVAGTSAGAITAAMIAAGYDASEMIWLLSPEGELRDRRPTVLPPGVSAFSFKDVLDFPSSADDIPVAVRRETLLWKAINMTLLDTFAEQALSGMPTRSSISEAMTTALMGAELRTPLGPLRIPSELRDTISNIVTDALGFIPDRAPTAGDFLSWSTTYRRELADKVWEGCANQENLSGYLAIVNLVYRGGMCPGEVFTETLDALLRAKAPPQGNASRTRFCDLEKELVLIAANVTTHEMEVYSRRTRPTMAVAEAVRRSMSVPFLFKPVVDSRRGREAHEIMDGGLCSNFAYWVFSRSAEELGYITHDAEDDARPKLGFTLDDRVQAPSVWDCLPEKFRRNGQAYRPFELEGLDASFDEISLVGEEAIPDIEMVERLFDVLETMSRSQRLNRKLILPTVMANYPYHEIDIPLLGYSWLDFSVNHNEQAFLGMVDRGWNATVNKLQRVGMISPGQLVSPFRP